MRPREPADQTSEVDTITRALGRLPRSLAIRPTVRLVGLADRPVVEGITPNGQTVIVKVDAAPCRHTREVVALEALADAGLPVPRILMADPTLPTLLVITKLEGTPLSMHDGAAAWTSAGAVLRAVHELTPPEALPTFAPRGRSWGEHVRWWAGHECDLAVQRGDLDPGVTRAARQLLDTALRSAPDRPGAFLHGDCQPEHFLAERGGALGVIDLGDASLGDAVWDLAVLTARQPQRLMTVLDGYGPSADMDARIRGLIEAYRLLRHLGSASWMKDHGYDPALDTGHALRVVADAG